MLKGSLSSPSFNRPLTGKSSELSDERLCIIAGWESSGQLILGVDISLNNLSNKIWIIDVVSQHPKLKTSPVIPYDGITAFDRTLKLFLLSLEHISVDQAGVGAIKETTRKERPQLLPEWTPSSL